MNTVRLTASPGAHGCRAWGGCTPDDRCAEHRDTDPQPVGELLGLALRLIAPPAPQWRKPQLRLIQGGKR
ncbi:hypothetical protein [Micromonospora sp. LOL_024]|uniref:hypothetical protein n=1 Tax=Micromonospora sp. LOL_024 TaxID=3345412 RepID=UPI003A85E946